VILDARAEFRIHVLDRADPHAQHAGAQVTEVLPRQRVGAGPPVARRGEVVAVLALVIELAVMASSLSVSTHGCAVTIVLTTRVVHGLRARGMQKLCAGH